MNGMAGNECKAEERNTILAVVSRLEDRLNVLHINLDNLIERNADCAKSCGMEQSQNVFDEIVQRLTGCVSRVTVATDKVQDEIANKVH